MQLLAISSTTLLRIYEPSSLNNSASGKNHKKSLKSIFVALKNTYVIMSCFTIIHKLLRHSHERCHLVEIFKLTQS